MYKILIVEDEVIAAEHLKNILEAKGWMVVGIVDNGVDAIKSICQDRPDVVLMDIMINDSKSGCEVAVDIRKISNCSIVFLTAYTDDEMIGYAMQVKADGYIVKPYNEQEIIATISLLGAKKNQYDNGFKITKLKDNFFFNHNENLLYKDSKLVRLGPKAIKLIKILCSNRDTFVSYKELCEKIWDDKINLKKLQMIVYRIREICEADFIENINGVGYKIKIEHALG